MRCVKKSHIGNVGTNKYATAEDFDKIFAENLDSLYLLSLLLTGDHEKAGQSLFVFVMSVLERYSTVSVQYYLVAPKRRFDKRVCEPFNRSHSPCRRTTR